MTVSEEGGTPRDDTEYMQQPLRVSSGYCPVL
jgi:hypothetical protein